MNTKLLNNLTYTYLSIPTIIFLIGWCKPIISIPITILILLSIIYRIKNNKINILKEIKDNKKTIIITLIISLIIIYLSGIGGYTFQNEDHLYRNTIFEELVNNNWPIYHNEIGNYNKSIIFTYYFASWLPASIIAKITNISIGYLFLYLWNVTGLFIVLNYLKTYSKDKGYSVILLFLLFSGLDILSEIYNGNNPFKIILNSTHMEWGTTFQMSSFITQLFWVYNQAIPAWLITLFILKEKDNKYIGTIIAMSLLFCTFPPAGLLFILIYKVFIENKSNIKEWLKNTFTWQNILIGLPLLIIYYLFIGTNNSSQSIKNRNRFL